jgi:hypothetical protein
MKKIFKLLVLVILLGGWVMASRSLYLVRAPGKFAGIPHTEWAGRFALITKDCMGWRDTYADTSHWTPTDLTNHAFLVQRIKESGRKDLISHVTEEGLASAAKTNVTPDAAVTPAPTAVPEEKQEKTIFDFPDKK